MNLSKLPSVRQIVDLMVILPRTVDSVELYAEEVPDSKISDDE
jgi:hypothetical protein